MDENVLVEKQHKKGKLYTRERLELLFDNGVYSELTSEENRDGVWVCTGEIAGKKAVVAAQDFTWKGGSLGRVHGRNIVMAQDYSIRKKIPFICINDSGGTRVQEGIGALAYYGEIFRKNVQASGLIPQICAVLGPCAGGAAYSPAIMDFIFTVRNISQMYITGPKVIKEVIGETVTMEELGGSRIHSHVNGNADFEYDSETECLEGIRHLVEILPRNYKSGQKAETSYKVPSFHFQLPDNPRRVYDVHELINCVFDEGSFIEVKKGFAEASVPKGNNIIRKAFGGAYIAMNSKHLGAEEVFAWPTAEIAVMGAKSAVSLLYGKKIKDMPQDQAKVFYDEKVQEYTQMASDLKFGLEQGYIDHVIHPEETRKALSDWLRTSGHVSRRGIRKKHGDIPL